MEGRLLAQTIAGAAGKNNAYFQKRRQSMLPDLPATHEHKRDVAMLMPIEHDVAGEQGIVASYVVTTDLKRCIVQHAGGVGPRVKVYFDGASHQCGRQRGWADCQAPGHTCICYRFVEDSSRSEFATRMWLWVKQGLDNPHVEGHLKWTPSNEACLEAMHALEFVDF